MDLDDKRNKVYGEWYGDRNSLILEKLKGLVLQGGSHSFKSQKSKVKSIRE
ncbi:MAG: hypothetical protein V7K48_28320 [Nostoc sp.]|uniref:hypothetical protein n=1 Tax=Nostoc sp. TaxID=1180 RepID=UPI002FF51711